MGSDLMRTVYVQACIRFLLGKQGENEAVRVVWPGIIEKFRKLYGNGVFTLTAKRCGDAAAYPVAVSTEGGDVVWLVRAADVANPGSGSCELTYTVDGVVAKSQTWSTYVAASISGDAPGEPPEEPAKAWFAAIQAQIGNLDDLTTKAKASLVAAVNEAARTGSGGAGSISMRTADGYIQYSTDGGANWENLIALADLKGDPGPQGEPGTPGKDGADGAPGKDGITPHIGDNGNWYIGSSDTGNPSRGEKGAGAEVYYVDLTGEYPNYTCTTPMADIAAAYAAGRELKCRCHMGDYILTLPLCMPAPSVNTWVFSGSGALAALQFSAQSFTIAIVNGEVLANDTGLATTDDIPISLPNPYALIIKTGNETVTYDGSEAKTVEITGGSVSMRVDGGYIQYSTDNGANWGSLIALTDLKGAPGKNGADGVTPHIGDNGNWYIGNSDTGKPSRGATGAKGPNGADGKTPVRGTDYWTEADKQEIINSVIAALPDGTEVSY